MEYKSLLFVHSIHDSISSLKPAISIARHVRASLDILVLSLAPPVPTIAMTPSNEFDWDASFQDTLQNTIVESRQRVIEITEWANNIGAEVSVTSSCQQLGLLVEEVAKPALYADLVLYHRCGDSMVSGIMAKALDGAILHAAKPALVLTTRPDTTGDVFEHITIAWDPAPSAMRALSASLPFLKRAIKIELLTVAKSAETEASLKSLAPVITWLKRHDLVARVNVVPKASRSLSATLLAHINASDADLVVMGAYGHSKFSERLFGGVSHTLLESGTKSLFIAH